MQGLSLGFICSDLQLSITDVKTYSATGFQVSPSRLAASWYQMSIWKWLRLSLKLFCSWCDKELSLICVLHNLPPLCINSRRGTFKSQWQLWGRIYYKTGVMTLIMFGIKTFCCVEIRVNILEILWSKVQRPLSWVSGWPWLWTLVCTALVSVTKVQLHSLSGWHTPSILIITASSALKGHHMYKSSWYQGGHRMWLWHSDIGVFFMRLIRNQSWTPGCVWFLINWAKILPIYRDYFVRSVVF